jgi:hypothetical protein
MHLGTQLLDAGGQGGHAVGTAVALARHAHIALQIRLLVAQALVVLTDALEGRLDLPQTGGQGADGVGRRVGIRRGGPRHLGHDGPVRAAAGAQPDDGQDHQDGQRQDGKQAVGTHQ